MAKIYTKWKDDQYVALCDEGKQDWGNGRLRFREYALVKAR
jgi:hypothetical protein